MSTPCPRACLANHRTRNRRRRRYPGLKSFPQKALADKQHDNGLHGGMLWFEVRGGTEAGRKLMDTVQRPWSLCENLGATESIITCPAVCPCLVATRFREAVLIHSFPVCLRAYEFWKWDMMKVTMGYGKYRAGYVKII